MKNLYFLICACFLAIALSGCLETEEHYTINPNGSGKVRYKFGVQVDHGTVQSEESDPRTKAKNIVIEVLQNSDGVDAWKDVSYQVKEDDRIEYVNANSGKLQLPLNQYIPIGRGGAHH